MRGASVGRHIYGGGISMGVAYLWGWHVSGGGRSMGVAYLWGWHIYESGTSVGVAYQCQGTVEGGSSASVGGRGLAQRSWVAH